MILSIQPADAVHFDGILPGDPFVAQTALARAAIARGISRLRNVADDPSTERLIGALQVLGCTIERRDDLLTITPPDGGLTAPAAPIEIGTAGYALRLLIGILAGRGVPARIVADVPLNRRNIERVLDPLRALGAELTSSDRGTPPVHVFPGAMRSGEHVPLPIGNAFVKSALIAAARAAGVELTVTEPAPSRDHAERIFEGAWETSLELHTVRIPAGEVAPIDWTLPSDSSLADHLTALAILRPGSSISIARRLVTPTERRLLDTIVRLGGAVELADEPAEAVPEPTATLTAGTSTIGGRIELGAESVRGFEAEIPLLAVAIGCGGGELIVRGAMNMRQQTCDRIAALVDNLGYFGIETEEHDDGLRVAHTGTIEGGIEISAYDDPVIAPAMIVLCAAADKPCVLHDVPDDPRGRELARLLGPAVSIVAT